jgi:hypothetical protein
MSLTAKVRSYDAVYFGGWVTTEQFFASIFRDLTEETYSSGTRARTKGIRLMYLNILIY